jgi:hypothetical protein
MHRIARKCIQARLYPTPFSFSKLELKAQLNTLIADIGFHSKLHIIYAAALMLLYTMPIQAVLMT